MPEVTVVVPARNAVRHLGRLLAALSAQELRPAAVVVVDDGSTDGTAAVAAAHSLAPAVIAGSGAGSYAARTLGLSAVTTEVVAFTDADCEPTPTWLIRGVRDVAPGL